MIMQYTIVATLNMGQNCTVFVKGVYTRLQHGRDGSIHICISAYFAHREGLLFRCACFISGLYLYTAQYSPVQPGISAQYRPIQPNTGQYSPVQPNTGQYSPVYIQRYIFIQHTSPMVRQSSGSTPDRGTMAIMPDMSKNY